jgi:hypothetical protein
VGSVGLEVSISQFQKLLEALKERLNDTALQISAIQDQIDSLEAVVLQNSSSQLKKEIYAFFWGKIVVFHQQVWHSQGLGKETQPTPTTY